MLIALVNALLVVMVVDNVTLKDVLKRQTDFIWTKKQLRCAHGFVIHAHQLLIVQMLITFSLDLFSFSSTINSNWLNVKVDVQNVHKLIFITAYNVHKVML
jgi:hypothetical protein